ncbi:EF-hand domain-containing protein [Methylocystis heyeri]|nr:EF-hand domain-containing protein [Methylocystis heyeri]
MHSRKFLRAALFGAAIGATGAVFAQQSDPRTSQIESRFKMADKNGDGKLTLDEAKLGMPRVAKHFDQIDKDKKGYVTLDEVKDAAAAAGVAR